MVSFINRFFRRKSVILPISPPPTHTSISSFSLPARLGIEKGLFSGRNVYEGYQRGWGIEFGGLKEKIQADILYQEALALARGRTILAEEKLMNIYLLIRFFLDKLPAGHVIEYGSYRGGSAIFMAYLAKKLFPEMKVFALDTFEGMPKTDKRIDAHNKDDFSDTDLHELQEYVESLNLDNLVLVKGLFEDTNGSVMGQAKNICLAHIDCDIASAVQFSYEGVKPYMVDGGYVIFDDATASSCIGATQVVEDILIRRDGLNSEQIYPHFVFRIFN